MLRKIANARFVKSKLEPVKVRSRTQPKLIIRTVKQNCWTLYVGLHPVNDELKKKLAYLKKKFTKKQPQTRFTDSDEQNRTRSEWIAIMKYKKSLSEYRKSLTEYNRRRKQILTRKPMIRKGELNEKDYKTITKSQRTEPQLVYKPSDGQPRIWMYKNAFYRDTNQFTPTQIAALLDTQISKTKKKVDLAVEMNTASETSPSTKRESIPDDVKVFVWRRDEGQCIKCGSRENLEFDHIIPFSMGGSNTSRNLQLLCEPCNREKGGNLV